MPDVVVRPYHDWPLAGGTLLVSVPQFGLGSTLLGDHLLDVYAMETYAALDCDEFPPIAMVRRGRARYPMRIHADASSRLAVLRSELQPAPYLARPLARAVLRWAKTNGLASVVALDNIMGEDGAPPTARPPILGIASTPSAQKALADAGIEALDEAVLGGMLGMLVLESRFHDVDVLALVAELHAAADEAQSILSFAEVLPRVVRGVRLDLPRLQRESREVAETIRGLQAEIERTVRQMAPREKPDGPPIYG